MLQALFAEAKKLGISQETLREDVAPGVINKRLSAATSQEVARVLVYIHNRHGIPDGENPKSEIVRLSAHDEVRSPIQSGTKFKRYESSRAGLLEEIRDLAIARFGEDFVRPLNALCERFGVEGYRSMRVSQAKAVKATLIRLQREDPRNVRAENLQPLQPETLNTKQETQNSKIIIFQKGRVGLSQEWEIRE